MRFESRTIPAPDVQALLERATAAYLGETVVIHEGAVLEAQRPADWEHDGPPGPLWLGGLAFDGDGTGPWAGFPKARFTLPKRQWARIDGTWTETVCDAPALPQPATVDGGLDVCDKASWAGMIASVREAIHRGDVTKVVLARVAEGSAGDPAHDLMALMQHGDGTGFLFRSGATFFGCTPERLVRLQGGVVETHALAGSTRSSERGENLQASEKDLLEHELVVAFVRERLVEAGVHGVHQRSRGLRPLRHVQHLETPILGQAPPGTHILDLATMLHPTPAVCGTPRQNSRALIERLEPFDRGWYAGAVGWFDPDGQGELSVALRCALDTGSRRFLFAGAGIVAGSEAEAEWDETEAKMAALQEVS